MNASIFFLNQTRVQLQSELGKTMLDVIRHNHRLTGCKEACREGDCGSCLVLLGKLEKTRLIYRPVTACLIAVGAVVGDHVVTIEGLNGASLNPIQQALVDQGGIQCGFCTPGIVIALTAFFLNSRYSDIDAAIDAVAGNLCRCTGYIGIKRAIKQLCEQFNLAESPLDTRLQDCIQWGLLPGYFVEIAQQLTLLPVVESHCKSEDDILVGGGTDLWVQRADRLVSQKLYFSPVVDSYDCVRLENGQCHIDAATSIEQLRTSLDMQALLPSIDEDMKLLCSAPVRQRATVAGNIANASPIGDLSVLFLALDATVQLGATNQQRNLRLRDFFLGYKQTMRQPDEPILAISFDCLEGQTGFSFEKVSKRQFLDIASVNSALSIRLVDGLIDTIHLSAGGVAPIPLYLSASCEYLRGKSIRADIIVKAADIADSEIEPISDLRGSAEYKRLLLRQLIFAHFLKLFPQYLSWEALHALS